MTQVTGFINKVLVNEYSKLSGVNENIEDQLEHVVWECGSCGEVNILFPLSKNNFGKMPAICKCDLCHKINKVFWKDKPVNVIDKYADEKLEGDFNDKD